MAEVIPISKFPILLVHPIQPSGFLHIRKGPFPAEIDILDNQFDYDYYGNGQEHPRRVQQFSPGDDAVDNGNGVKVEGLPHKSRINGNDI